MGFDNFDWEDSIEFAEAAGFAEESMREEEQINHSEILEDFEPDNDEAIESVITLDRQLQMLAASNPGLARYTIRSAMEHREQGALHAQATQLLYELEKASKLQDEEEKNGTLRTKTMNDSITKMARYKYGTLDDKDCEEYPDVLWIQEAITEGWKASIDYLNFKGEWEQGLIIQPERTAKQKDKIFIYAFCEQWKKHWYFRMDRMKNMKPILANEI